MRTTAEQCDKHEVALSLNLERALTNGARELALYRPLPHQTRNSNFATRLSPTLSAATIMHVAFRILAVIVLVTFMVSGYYLWTSLPPRLPSICKSAYGEPNVLLLPKEDIVRQLVNWIIDGEPLGDSDLVYPGSVDMDQQKRFIVSCSDVRRDLPLSRDIRVYRIPREQFAMRDVFNALEYDGHDYINIWFLTNEKDILKVKIHNHYDWDAGHSYDLTFARDGTFIIGSEKLTRDRSR